jgi:hypothetical protein
MVTAKRALEAYKSWPRPKQVMVALVNAVPLYLLVSTLFIGCWPPWSCTSADGAVHTPGPFIRATIALAALGAAICVVLAAIKAYRADRSRHSNLSKVGWYLLRWEDDAYAEWASSHRVRALLLEALDAAAISFVGAYLGTGLNLSRALQLTPLLTIVIFVGRSRGIWRMNPIGDSRRKR